MNFGYFKCDNIFYFSCSPLNKCSLAELQADYLAVFIVLILVTSQVGRDKSQLIKKKLISVSGWQSFWQDLTQTCSLTMNCTKVN